MSNKELDELFDQVKQEFDRKGKAVAQAIDAKVPPKELAKIMAKAGWRKTDVSQLPPFWQKLVKQYEDEKSSE